MNKKLNQENKIVLFTNKDGNIELRADVEKDTLWATLDQIARLFGRDKSVISRHLRNVFITHELIRSSVVAKNATTAADGKTYMVEYYNLDAILSVGYRVNSKHATQFRIWATKILHDYLIKGYSLNRHQLMKSDAYVEGLHEAVTFLESNKNDGPLKGKVTFKLEKHLTGK